MIHVVPRGEHSHLGPSSAERWINCPGSVKASRNHPRKSSVYAAEGSAAHYLADLLHRGGGFSAGDIVQCDGHEFTVTPEWIKHILAFDDWCSEMPGDQLSEVRVHYEAWIPDGFGTIDRAALQNGLCHIRDLKFGQGVQVFAKENEQLMVYGLGLIADYGWLYDIQGFELGIDQPRLGHRDVWEISRTDLTNWAFDVLVPAFSRVQKGEEFKAGPWCQFCPFKFDCAVRANQGLAEVLADFEDLDAADPELKDIKLLTQEDKARMYPNIAVLKSWIADFEKGIIADMMRGVKNSACKLVAGRSNRKWNSPSVSIQIAEAGVEPYEKKLRSPAQVEEEMGKKRFRETLGGLVVKPPGRPTLVPQSDPRPEVDLNPNEFSNLDEEE